MKREEYIRELFSQALEKLPAERGQFLDGACEGEPELRLQVESLLRDHERAGDLLQRPSQMPPPEATPVRAGLGQANTIELSEAAFTRPMIEGKAGCFAGYELLGAIAQGGMGVVYKARHVRLSAGGSEDDPRRPIRQRN